MEDGAEIPEELISLLRTNQFGDVLVPGFTEKADAARRFRLLPDVVYLVAGPAGPYLQLATLDQGDQLRMKVTNRIEHDQAVVDDEVDAAFVSLAEIYFGEAESLPCVSLRCLLDERSAIASGVVKFAEFTFAGDQRISFDPLWTFGFRLGSGRANERFQKDVPGPFGFKDEYLWKADRLDGLTAS